MKLNKNSFSAKFYCWFYETNKLPNNLCPYFWKLSLAWLLTIVLFPPMFFLLIPAMIISIFSVDFKTSLWGNKFTFAIMGIFIYAALLIAFSIVVFAATILGLIGYVSGSWLSTFQIWGGIISCAGAGVGVYYLGKLIIEHKKKNSYKSPNIVKEFIKAKYNKYCPKIDWN